MVVIMKHDMADNGIYNPDRRRTIPREKKKSIETTMKPIAETCVISSTAWQGIK
jgi:hypothetical protein